MKNPLAPTPADRAAIQAALDQFERAAQDLETAVADCWPSYTRERWRKLKRSLEILASDLRAGFGGGL